MMATDPVCGMKIDEKQAAAKVELAGQVYYFCSDACHKAFTANPEKYIRTATGGASHRGHAAGGQGSVG